jgi:putative addiction module killer protein
MNTLVQSHEFASWLAGLRDLNGRARIADRVVRAEAGNFGDCASVGDGISEMRIHSGPGYRIYFTRRGEVVYLLLIGGDKSTQPQDIASAKAMLSTLPKE